MTVKPLAKTPFISKARIYRPAKTAMQSGRAKTRVWLLEYEPTPKFTDPLMGWTGSMDTRDQLRLKFPSLEAAETYAKIHNIPYEVELPHSRNFQRKSYADNFSFDRVATHNLSGNGSNRKNNNDWAS